MHQSPTLRVTLASNSVTEQHHNIKQSMLNCILVSKINVCLWNTMPPGGNKVQKAIFSFKVKVKVTRSMTMVSIESASLVKYACQIWSLYLLRFKSYIEVKVDNRQTYRQTNRQDKNNMPRSFDPGAQKHIMSFINHICVIQQKKYMIFRICLYLGFVWQSPSWFLLSSCMHGWGASSPDGFSMVLRSEGQCSSVVTLPKTSEYAMYLFASLLLGCWSVKI